MRPNGIGMNVFSIKENKGICPVFAQNGPFSVATLMYFEATHAETLFRRGVQ
jgi:hypothetical protein